MEEWQLNSTNDYARKLNIKDQRFGKFTKIIMQM